jgi:hypothetical protein
MLWEAIENQSDVQKLYWNIMMVQCYRDMCPCNTQMRISRWSVGISAHLNLRRQKHLILYGEYICEISKAGVLKWLLQN